MKRMRKEAFLLMLFTVLCGFVQAQTYFYGGYSFARYNTPEIATQNYITKFNLGWNYTQNFGSAAIPV
ncbi:MAG: hypothetical protein ACRCYO_04315, partial [Bacteroidia bacterium]